MRSLAYPGTKSRPPAHDGASLPRPAARRWRIAAAIAALAVVLAGWAAPASAQCFTAVSVSQTQQMNFGTIAVNGSSGTVTIASNGTVTVPGGFVHTGAGTAGAFKATGSPFCPAVLSFTAGALTGPGTAMTINGFTNSAGGAPFFNIVGTLTFNVGANLLVNAGQAGGTYSGTYTVTVVY